MYPAAGTENRSLADVLVRSATRDELPDIVRLLADDSLGAAREVAGEPVAEVYTRAFEQMMAHPGNEVLVAVHDGAVVGCMQLTLIAGLSRAGATRAQIEGVRVDSRVRGRGVGEAMMREAIKRARAEGCGMVQLTSDQTRTDALRFYERLGFVPSHIGLKLSLE